MDITGKLEAPQLSFDIELPDANEEQRELLASAVNTPEQKNMQFIYLMGIGKFYTYDYNRNNNGTDQVFVNNPLSWKSSKWFDIQDLMDNVKHEYTNVFVIISK